MNHVTYPLSSRAPHHRAPSYTDLPSPPTKHIKPTPKSSMAQNPETQQNLPYQMVKASTALTFGGSLSVLSGLTLTAAIICLTAVTPLLVIFSPVLVPAAIAMLLLATGFFSSGGLGVTAAFVFYWLHNYVTGKHPVGADRLDQLAAKLARAASRTEQRSPVSTS